MEQGDTHLARAIPNTYAALDAWTGQLVQRLDPDTVVIIVSDHGMGPKGRLPQPEVGGSGDHDPKGVFIACGPGVPAGADIGVVDPLDFTPTVLDLLGLPVAQDMPGHAVPALFPDGSPPRSVPTYGDGRSGDDATTPSPSEKEYLDRLRALGYVQ